jgi:hypothetical protein
MKTVIEDKRPGAKRRVDDSEALGAINLFFRGAFGGTCNATGVRRDPNGPSTFLVDTDYGDVEFSLFQTSTLTPGVRYVNIRLRVPAAWDADGVMMRALHHNMPRLGLDYEARADDRRVHTWVGLWDEFFLRY